MLLPNLFERELIYEFLEIRCWSQVFCTKGNTQVFTLSLLSNNCGKHVVLKSKHSNQSPRKSQLELESLKDFCSKSHSYNVDIDQDFI